MATLTSCDCTVCAYAKKHPQTGARLCWQLTGETITRDQLLELRHSTGWIGERCERDQRLIGAALRGDPVARGLCAGIYNERRRAAPLTCDHHDSHDPVDDRPAGNRCGAPATHRITWADGRFSFGCAAHLEIDDAATVKPINIVPLNTIAAEVSRG